MDEATGETLDSFRCLHSDLGTAVRNNPFQTYVAQWNRYRDDVVVPNAAEARRKVRTKVTWPLLWETREVCEELVCKKNIRERRPAEHEGHWSLSEEVKAETRKTAATCLFSVDWREENQETKEWGAPRLIVHWLC